jgi:hypothetical protein
LALKGEWEKAKQEADQTAAEARRAHPEKVFQEVTSHVRYHDLFPAQLIKFTNSLDDVHFKVVRALGRNPVWNVQNTQPDTNTVIIHAEIKSFGGRKNVVLVLGQTADNEVAIYFKLIELTLDTKIGLSLTGVSEDSYTPLHRKHVSALRVPFVEKQRAASLQEFRKRIEDELH